MRKDYRDRAHALLIFLGAGMVGISGSAARGEFVNETAKVGINLTSINSWEPTWPFLDVMKKSRPWISHRSDVWDTGEAIALRSDGYPASLLPGQWAGTLINDSISGRYPGGRYTLLFDGDGVLELNFDATVAQVQSGQLLVDVTPTNDGIHLVIKETNPANPIRNIRLITPGFEHNFQTQVFHPQFVQFLGMFGVIRFMDWQRTNWSVAGDWSKRTTPQSATQGGPQGVALEHMIHLCNRLNADAWFCMPHGADDHYVRQFATMVRNQLEPNLRVYVELSNEVWNGIFHHGGQGDHFETMGELRGYGIDFEAKLRAYSVRTVEVVNIWKSILPSNRVIGVMGSQSVNPFVSTTALDFQNAFQHVDALAIAPYFGGELGTSWDSPIDTPNASLTEILNATEASLGPVMNSVRAQKQVADARGLTLVAYEAGQHLAAIDEWQKNNEVVGKLIAANRDWRMGDIYFEYLRNWWEEGAGVMMMFADVSHYTKFGSWGLVEHADPLQLINSPKFLATWDFIRRADTWVNFNDDESLNTGTPKEPFNSLQGASALVLPGGDIHFRRSDSGESLVIAKEVTLNATGGVARIGLPGAPVHPSYEEESDPFDIDFEKLRMVFGATLEKALGADGFAASGVSEMPIDGNTALSDSGAWKSPDPFAPVLPIPVGNMDRDFLLRPGDAISLRLRSALGIDRDTITVFAANYTEEDLSWRVLSADGTNTDLWVVVTCGAGWFAGDPFTVSANAFDAEGERIVAGPYRFRAGSIDELNAQQAETGDAPHPVEDSEPPVRWSALDDDGWTHALTNRIGSSMLIEPVVYSKPRRVWLPIPSGVSLSELALYYYIVDGSGGAWELGGDVANWLGSARVDTVEGTGHEQYLGLDIRHGGIVQFGLVN